jgi:HlyD family secretion protein
MIFRNPLGGQWLRRSPNSTTILHWQNLSRLACMVCAALLCAGCHSKQESLTEKAKYPQVTCVRPQRASVGWTVRQPGYIEAFEETPIFPKIMGYVEKWHANIGDQVKKGDVLAKLWVPDLVGELREKEAQVGQARKAFDVARAEVEAEATLIDEAEAGLDRAKAEFAFSKTQYERISKLEASVIEKQVKTESLSQLRGREATTAEAKARVAHAKAALKGAEAASDKCQSDIAVAEAARDRLAALVAYATLLAPFDGVITRRNVHTGDFVQPPTASDQPPLYVLQQRDVVRVFIEVPERDAVWLKPGVRATIRVDAVNGLKCEGEVTRMAYALKAQSRTLLAEVDLPNDDDVLRPGMYVTAEIAITRHDLLTLPRSAIASDGDVNEGYHTYCYLLDEGKVRRCEVEIGSRGDDRWEVIRKQVNGVWTDFSGSEQFVGDNVAALSDGQPVLASGQPEVSENAREPISDRPLSEAS